LQQVNSISRCTDDSISWSATPAARLTTCLMRVVIKVGITRRASLRYGASVDSVVHNSRL
jgi:hypothetical protein